MRRNIILGFIILLGGLGGKIYAQQDPLYSQYMFDRALITPAYAGSSNWIVGSVKHRQHMRGIDGAPMTNLLTFHAPLQKKSMGLGLKAIYDLTAVNNTFSVSGIYSYHIGFGKGKLSFGLEGGVVNSLTNYDELVRYDPDDLSIPVGAERVTVPDASFGIYYHTEKWYAGGAANHLFNMKNTVPNYDRNQLIELNKSFYAFAGYIIDLGKSFAIEPSTFVKYTTGAPVQADLNMNFIVINRVTLGGSYRTGDAAAVLLKIDITEGLRIAYSYDIGLSALSTYSTGSHEFMISYGVKLLPPPAKKEVHPRYYF